MPFNVTAVGRTAGDRAYDAYVLTADDSTAEVWPELGCNTVGWQVPAARGKRQVLYAPPAAELFDRPTRGGVPILFPFPNRIRGGRFAWAGQHWQLPPNDPAQANAIHGFTPRLPWNVLDHGTDATS